MVKPQKKTVCWDSCTFLSFIEATAGRAEALHAIFEEAVRKEIRLLASVICVTEVAFTAAERKKRLSKKTEKAIAKLWQPGSPVEIVDYSLGIARKAQTLLRHKILKKIHLKPLDAIHIATAMQGRASELHTYDGRLQAWSAISGVSIKEPEPHQMLLPESASDGKR